MTVMCLLVICSMVGQQTNPFDITNRNTELIPAVVPTQVAADSGQIISAIPAQSPVEVQELSTEEVISEVVAVDTVIPDTKSIEISTEEEPQTSFLEAQQQKLMSQNPFNVSHIPLKRSTKSTKIRERVVEKAAQEVSLSAETQAAPTPISSTRESIVESKINKFIFWLLLLQLLLITSLLGINREIIKKIYRSISNDNFAKLVSRDYNGGYNALFVILYILFFLSLSIFIYLVFRKFYGANGFAKYLLALLSVVGIYSFRHVFQGFTAYVFPFGKTSSYFNFMIILFNSFLGLILIPINIIVAYAPNGLATMGVYLGIGSFVILYLLRFLRGSLHAYTYVRNYLFHFFLYLCTCEFAPLFILAKFLSNTFIN